MTITKYADRAATHLVVLLLVFLSLSGCHQDTPTPETQHTTGASDSAFKRLLGKQPIKHQGPADILADTAGNADRDSALTGRGKLVKIPD